MSEVNQWDRRSERLRNRMLGMVDTLTERIKGGKYPPGYKELSGEEYNSVVLDGLLAPQGSPAYARAMKVLDLNLQRTEQQHIQEQRQKLLRRGGASGTE